MSEASYQNWYAHSFRELMDIFSLWQLCIISKKCALLTIQRRNLWINQNPPWSYMIQYIADQILTTGRPLLIPTPSCSIKFLEMVMEGRSRLWGGNCGVKWDRWGLGCSGSPGKDEPPSWRPRPDSVSGGGVMGGISNSSSPRLGVWNVWRERKKTDKEVNNSTYSIFLLSCIYLVCVTLATCAVLSVAVNFSTVNDKVLPTSLNPRSSQSSDCQRTTMTSDRIFWIAGLGEVLSRAI